jgi:hypothetical protein
MSRSPRPNRQVAADLRKCRARPIGSRRRAGGRAGEWPVIAIRVARRVGSSYCPCMQKIAGLSTDAQPETVAAHPSPRSSQLAEPSQAVTPSPASAVDGRSQITGTRYANNDLAFIAEAAEVERLRQELDSRGGSHGGGEPDRRFEYLFRRANLLTCLAEQTGDTEDRTLAKKAWESLRALTRDRGRPRLVAVAHASWFDHLSQLPLNGDGGSASSSIPSASFRHR